MNSYRVLCVTWHILSLVRDGVTLKGIKEKIVTSLQCILVPKIILYRQIY